MDKPGSNGHMPQGAAGAEAGAAAAGDGDEPAARRLLARADRLLPGRAVGVPPPDFVTQLFARAAPEDVVRYEAAELADIAAGTWHFLSARQPQTPNIRVDAALPGPRLKHVSIIELVNDDMPFLVDSVMAELAEQGLEAHLVVHPLFTVVREASGKLTAFLGEGGGAAAGSVLPMRESLIQVQVDRVEEESRRHAIADALAKVLADVRRAVEDWRAILQRLKTLIVELKQSPPPPPLTIEEIAESIQFLEWLMDDNFTFLGVRDYRFGEDDAAFTPVPHSSLGILRGAGGDVMAAPGGRIVLPPRALAVFKEAGMLVITKTSSRARVHRRVVMDHVVLKHFDGDGRLAGGFLIVGLFTSTAYVRSTRSIPYLRRKVANIMARARFGASSHSGKALANVLETYPRDELFQVDEDTLYRFALTILELGERPRVRVLPRRDPFERFVSILVYTPRDRYDSAVRAAIGKLLASAFNGRVVSFAPFFPEGPVVRVHFIIAREDGDLAQPERAGLESAVSRLVATWTDRLREALAAAHDPAEAHALFATYGGAFSAAYRDVFTPAEAVADIAAIAAMSREAPLGVDFARTVGAQAARLKLWSRGRPIPLSERVPVLEHMGFTVVDESTYQVAVGEGFWLHDIALDRSGGGGTDIETAKPRLDACFGALMSGEAEDDGYNALVLAAGLAWREVALVRCLSRYLRQIRVPYSQDYMWASLTRHAPIAERIVALFRTRFDPELGAPEQRNGQEAAILGDIEERLGRVESLDEDRIIRYFVNAVQAAVRTNFYQHPSPSPRLGEGRGGGSGSAARPSTHSSTPTPDPSPQGGGEKQVIAIKFDSRNITAMPLPRPRYEIFLCSPRLEAVHMRFGPVARGGIRWSDRPQDFRTEVLGLVKAQQVKNAVIVPVGAKGGFVPKRLAAAGSREAIQAEGVATYRIFMQTLLDLTDNLDLKGVVPPRDVVRRDGDDPYLVVAADKGTATFSDIANDIAQEHGFWLDDAFASGGSAGYDHKKMGITARGAWESVKRHFREMDVDISQAAFTVAGVGDMSGDVFGNGMLRERTIRLIAAFDHRDIFIDPDPDPQRSFDERQRLLDLPRSSWQDFDRNVISAGGGVFPRTLKEIDLSAAARSALGIAAPRATPQEVMNAILKAPVDLLWFGGIGTYVRATAETDDAVGDRANDAIRVAAAELRCKVIGEGANLGVTQRGRIEAAQHGIRLNSDAIDNSAGVNTSDVEVNLKIALSLPLRDGRLARADRDALLAEMTEDVAARVLRSNYQQTLALSLACRRGLDDLGFQQRLMQTLERQGLLDRAVEFLPDDGEIVERRRRGQPLTRPELAVLLAYGKLALKEELVKSNVPDDPYLGRELGRYFPPAIADRFPDAIEQHRLRRDIIATQLANSMINRGGPSLVVRLAEETGASVDRIAAAFAAVRDSFELTALNTAIEELDNRLAGAVQLGLFGTVQDLLLDRIVWFLRNVDLAQGLAGIVEHYRSGITNVAAALDRVLPEEAQRGAAATTLKMTSDGVPDELAQLIASLPARAAAADAVLIADRTRRPVEEVAAIYFAACAYFQLDRIIAAAADIKLTDYFDRLALDRALDAIGDAARRIAAEMAGAGGAEAVAAWVARKGASVERARSAVHEIAASGLTVSKLAVAASMLGDLARGRDIVT
jgi:glutamate dehydrogenase